jgi:hypothetical protein
MDRGHAPHDRARFESRLQHHNPGELFLNSHNISLFYLVLSNIHLVPC